MLRLTQRERRQRLVGSAVPVATLAGLFSAALALCDDRAALLERVASYVAARAAEGRRQSMQEWTGDPIWGTASEYATGAGLHRHAQRPHRPPPEPLCRSAGRRRPDRAGVGARDRGARARSRGLPPAPLEVAPERIEVECQRFHRFATAELLGASSRLANDLLPYALAAHARMIRLFPNYRDRHCTSPLWALPMSP